MISVCFIFRFFSSESEKQSMILSVYEFLVIIMDWFTENLCPLVLILGLRYCIFIELLLI